MGLRTGTSTAAAHYAVCVAKCADRINAITGDFDGPAVIERDAAAYLKDLFGHIDSDQLVETLGTVHEGGKKITLQQRGERVLWKRWMKNLAAGDRLHVKAHEGPHHHWVSVPPLEWAGHAMKPKIWVTAARRRLHLPVSPFPGDCPCCKGGRSDIWGTHQVMCAGGPGTQLKHNGIVKLIAEQARNAGYRVKIEPGPNVDDQFIYVGAGPGDKRHPDLLIYNWEGGKHLMIDVAVHNPLCASYCADLAEGGHGAVSTIKEDVKNTKYADLDPFRFDFMAFTLETTGAFGDSAAQLCAKLRKRQLERSCRAIDERSSRDPLITAISAEVQRQSAEMILAREPRARTLVVGSQLHIKTTGGHARKGPDNSGGSPNPPDGEGPDNSGGSPDPPGGENSTDNSSGSPDPPDPDPPPDPEQSPAPAKSQDEPGPSRPPWHARPFQGPEATVPSTPKHTPTHSPDPQDVATNAHAGMADLLISSSLPEALVVTQSPIRYP